MDGTSIADFRGCKIEIGEIVGAVFTFQSGISIKKVKVEGVKDDRIVLSYRNGSGKMFTTLKPNSQVVKLYKEEARPVFVPKSTGLDETL